jgi:hypothetical protein
MRRLMPLAILALAIMPLSAQAGYPFGKYFGCAEAPCQQSCQTCQPGCSNCQVHVHYCKPAPSTQEAPQIQRQAPQQTFTPQMLYSPILPSAVGFTMPMMPMMGTPVSYQPQVQQAPNTSSAPNNSYGGVCEERIGRLESGVKNLSERMDKMEAILENQTKLMQKLAEKIPADVPATVPKS